MKKNLKYDILTGKIFPSPSKNRVYDYSHSPQNKLGKLYDPSIDQLWVEREGVTPKWPNNKPYAVCITHDVDVISYQSKKENIRRMKHVLKTWSQQNAKQN